MFPWLCNYIDVKSIENAIYSQNNILQNLIDSMNKSSNYSLLATVILGVITVGITIYFGYQQNNISKRQHNLELFNKRWLALEELKNIGYEAESFKHIYFEDIKDSEKESYHAIIHKINFFASKCEILFDSNIKTEILQACKSFEEYHKYEDTMEMKNRHAKEYEKIFNEKIADIIDESPKLQVKMFYDFEKLYHKMLDFIRNTKI